MKFFTVNLFCLLLVIVSNRVSEAQQCQFFVANYANGATSYFLNSVGAVTPVNLLSDRVFQPASDGNGNMFYTSLTDKGVYSYIEATPTPVEAQIASFSSDTRAIAVDPDWQVVFVAVVQTGVFSMDYNGGNQRVMSSTGVAFPSALAVDLPNRDLFYLARNIKCLFKINYQDLDNPSQITIRDGFPEFPRSLVIDKPVNRMYILMENAAIWYINLLDFADTSQMISAPKQAFGGFGLTMCLGNLYYSDYSKKRVWRISKGASNGNNRVKFSQAALGTLTRGITLL